MVEGERLMAYEVMAALDLWTLFVNYIFGGFWLAIVGIMILIFAIMMMGKISINITTWYVIMFLMCMSLGYGWIPLQVIITALLLVASFYSWKGYLDSR